jgi:membrane protease YdiL (CAAX protease family)
MRQRLISCAEFLVGGAIVIGHNVYHKVPNEVPILFALGWISLHLRNGGWKAVGLRRPESWRKTVSWALVTAALVVVLSDLVVAPFAEKHFGVQHGAAELDAATVSVGWVLKLLLVFWTFAAFGEEMGYRGYLLNRAAEIGNQSKLGYLVALLCVSVLFGIGHYYKGPGGIIASSVSGFVLGAAYLLSGRNLWISILAHGFRDTFALVAALMGWMK